MTLFDILSNDERVIVYSDEMSRYIYTWNKSLTLQAWQVRSTIEEMACQTLSDVPINYEGARKAAIAWAHS